MKKKIKLILILSTIFSLFSFQHIANAQDTSGRVLVIELEGPLTPAMAEYLERGIQTAEQKAAEVLIVQLNTPGGSVELMSRMVELMRSSNVPVVVYVAPRGALAGSAGTVLTLAGHFSAMAPETAIGAASPVGNEGEDIGETLEAKIKEIIKAQIRSLSEGRPAEAVRLAEETVENAKALSVTEAFNVGLIDFVATDLADLMEQLDGQTVTLGQNLVQLETKKALLEVLPPTLIEELLSILTNPNIVFLLLSVGVQAILIELGSPGGWVAGFIGVVALALAGYGLGVLPVNYFGLLFLLIAFVLFFLEIKAPVHGALAVTGLASFITGALVLFNSPGSPQHFRVSIPLVVATGGITAASFIAILSMAIRAQKAPLRTGGSSLLGQFGEARSNISVKKAGQVYLAGESWSADLAEDEAEIKAGDHVQVVGVDGIRIKVRLKRDK